MKVVIHNSNLKIIKYLGVPLKIGYKKAASEEKYFRSCSVILIIEVYIHFLLSHQSLR
ncbi:hypothetical protein EVA_00492 [gut metagenome]|uniref:Uncharacterized protein n=1 Tax=gut metagenome TaxID=749906 RepID=J9GR00_9ZZZZ